MFGSKKKSKTTKINTLIGKGTSIYGEIQFSGGIHVDGTIKGNVTSENDGHSALSLSEDGTIEGDIKIPHVCLNGVVNGDVHCKERLELLSKARIKGNVYYNIIEMAEGAEVNGELVHTVDTTAPKESTDTASSEMLDNKTLDI